MAGKCRKSILLIDDDPLVLNTVTRLLEKSGHQVSAFQNPKEAIQEAMMDDFDLVISDIRMPEVNGLQAIRYMREMRSQQGKNQIPEIFITGYASDYGEEAEKLKPRAIVHKPFEIADFITVVNNALVIGD